MITKTLKKGISGLFNIKSFFLLFLLFVVKQALATPQPATKAAEGVSVIEILGYVGMIVGVILLAWLIGSAQSKGSSKPSTNNVAPRIPRHFNHPNDPHFRKLRKKTS